MKKITLKIIKIINFMDPTFKGRYKKIIKIFTKIIKIIIRIINKLRKNNYENN